LTVRKRAGKTGFRFSVASNFDASFAAFQIVSNDGYRSVSVPDIGAIGSQFRDQVRFLFNPADYTADVPAMLDDVPIYLQIEAKNPDGSFDAPEAIHVLLPYNSGPFRPVQLRGTIPQGADLTNSLEIQLPMQCNDIHITNDGAHDLYLAFERGSTVGPEYHMQQTSATDYAPLELTLSSITQLFLRGDSGTTTISAILTARNNPIGH
jgi:hypothetical protein